MIEGLHNHIPEEARAAFGVALLTPIISQVPSMNAAQFATHAWDTIAELERGQIESNEALQAVRQQLGPNIAMNRMLLKHHTAALAGQVRDDVFAQKVMDTMRLLEMSEDKPNLRRLLGY